MLPNSREQTLGFTYHTLKKSTKLWQFIIWWLVSKDFPELKHDIWRWHLKLGSLIPTVPLLFFIIILASWNFLCFYTNCTIFCFNSVKNVICIYYWLHWLCRLLWGVWSFSDYKNIDSSNPKTGISLHLFNKPVGLAY